MSRFLALCAIAAAGGLALPAQAVTLNLDGMANASLDGSNAVGFMLAAGTYRFSFVDAQYAAFSRFSSSSGCNITGGSCSTGFENSARIIVNGVTNLFGDGNASGGIGPISGGGYYDTAANSF